ncbi:GNAT family N-acetyltransferase [Geminicoccaceae bacterium 1502E]|nr:GNAT family N-acetyltransferase [Geminicoccaceae bacterium 1502E]
MSIAIRLAAPEDAALVLDMVREHALFEGEPKAVRASLEDYRRASAGPQPAFECLIAEVGGRTAGIALFFHNFSSWTGRRGVFLDDLFVREWARGRGVGEALVRQLARLALERGCLRLELSVMDGNPADGFYKRLGLRHADEWHPYRAEGEALERLAAD